MNKPCSKCAGKTISLRSTGERLCVDCLNEDTNKLKDDQKTLIQATR